MSGFFKENEKIEVEGRTAKGHPRSALLSNVLHNIVNSGPSLHNAAAGVLIASSAFAAAGGQANQEMDQAVDTNMVTAMQTIFDKTAPQNLSMEEIKSSHDKAVELMNVEALKDAQLKCSKRSRIISTKATPSQQLDL